MTVLQDSLGVFHRVYLLFQLTIRETLTRTKGGGTVSFEWREPDTDG